MLGHLRLLAEEEAQSRAALKRADPIDGAAVTPLARAAARTGKLALGLSLAALTLGIVSTAVAFYSLNVGLRAHVNAAIQQPAPAPAAGLEGLMGGLPDLFAQSIRLDTNTLGPGGMALLREAAASTGFSLNDQGQMVVMFSDPLCPACRQFEEWIAADRYQTFSPLMVPVALLQGSRDTAAAVLCSTEQVGAWQAAIAGNATGGAACAAGQAAVDRNNAIFATLGFTHTPTFVAMNGAILVGSRSPQEMAAWALQNTPQNTSAPQ